MTANEEILEEVTVEDVVDATIAEHVPVVDVERAIEAILMIADEPQSMVSIATAMSVPSRL